MRLKAHPVGQGNHENIHYVIRCDYYKLKLNAFPDTNKIYIMSSSSKAGFIFDEEFIFNEIKAILLSKFDLVLIGTTLNLFNLRFDNTKELMQSDYYLKSL